MKKPHLELFNFQISSPTLSLLDRSINGLCYPMTLECAHSSSLQKKKSDILFVFFPVMTIGLMGNGFVTFRGPCDRQRIFWKWIQEKRKARREGDDKWHLGWSTHLKNVVRCHLGLIHLSKICSKEFHSLWEYSPPCRPFYLIGFRHTHLIPGSHHLAGLALTVLPSLCLSEENSQFLTLACEGQLLPFSGTWANLVLCSQGRPYVLTFHLVLGIHQIGFPRHFSLGILP